MTLIQYILSPRNAQGLPVYMQSISPLSCGNELRMLRFFRDIVAVPAYRGPNEDGDKDDTCGGEDNRDSSEFCGVTTVQVYATHGHTHARAII